MTNDPPKPPAPPAAPPAPPPPTRREIASNSMRLHDEALMGECEVDVFIASGPGGQHRNKTESGVRLRHLPTGIVVTATERRSQFENKSHAVERLRAKLKELTFVPKPRKPTKVSRGAKKRRVDDKKKRGATKSMRGRPTHD